MFARSSTLAALSILVLFSLSAYAHVAQEGEPVCAHNMFNDEPPLLLDVEEEFLSNNTRFLATSSYPNIRMTADYTPLVSGTSAFITYVKTALMPPVLDYFRNALAVKQPLTSPLKLSTTTKTICGFTTPKALFTGVATDFYILVSSQSDETNWVASAGACYLSTTTKRSLIAKMLFNLVYTKATTDPLTHEKNTQLTIHEMTHALGFSGTAFPTFIDANGKTLTGHIKSVLLNGSTRTVINVEPLTSKLRTYFGCSTLPGAFMEDDGGAGTAGSHFERRHFIYEVMTSGVIYGLRVSQFTLAMLEGSGWYQPNYAYAEPFFAGQGEGCNYLYQDCTASTFKPANYAEFCSGSGRGCGPVGEGGGVCSNDTRSDGCRYHIPVYDYDCENSGASASARFPTKEVFGRNAGSRCFEGTLSATSSSASQVSMCLKFTCSGSGTSTSLAVMLGTTKVTCAKEGQVKVSGYYGYLNCPDPLTYCNTVGKKFCPRNCMGRGTCVNNACQCKSGYTGIDCGLLA